MTDTDITPDTFIDGHGVVVGADIDGNVWVGTQYWLIRSGTPTQPKPADITAHTAIPADQRIPLTRETIDGWPVTINNGDGRLRTYLRPDGTRVCLRNRYAAAVETAATDPTWWQGPKPLGCVYITDGPDPDGNIVSIIMPVRLDHAPFDGPAAATGNGNR